MAKVVFNTVIQNTNDTEFRAWATELHDALVASGLVQTSDTGQLASPVTAARPASGQYAGYWIFRFNDTLQAAAPVFLKVYPGRGSVGNAVQVLVEVGTGTNGAGTITGLVFNTTICVGTTNPNATPSPTYINFDEGFFGLAFKSTATTTGLGFFAFCRTTDDSGVPTSQGYFGVAKTSANTGVAVSGVWSGFSMVATDKSWCCPPFPGSSSAVGTDYQVYKNYGVFPNARIVPQLVAVLLSELPIGNETGPVEIMDGVTRNYLCPGVASSALTISGASTYALCMKWD